MAIKDIATGDAAAVKLWDAKVYREVPKKSFWLNGMAAADGSMPVHLKEQFGKGDGDRLTITMIPRLKGAYIGEAGTVVGNEESLSHYTFNLTAKEYNVATSFKTKLATIRPAWDLPKESQTALMNRMGEVIDEELDTQLETSPTKIFYTGSATSTATLTATDKMTSTKLHQMKVWAKSGGNRAQNPIGTIKAGGMDGVHLFICGWDMYYDLLEDSAIQQSQREALPRMKDHPLFRDQDLFYRNILIRPHENITLYTDGGAGSDVPYSYGYLVGASGLAWGWAQKPKLTQEAIDHQRILSLNYNFIGAPGKPKFNSLDWGVAAVAAARTQITDA